MIEHESLFKTFKGITKREQPLFPGYIYDIIGRIAGIVIFLFVILLIISFLSFAIKPFNITITRVIELFWRDFTFLLMIPISLPSFIGTIRSMFKDKDITLYCITTTYLFFIVGINVLVIIFGTLPILKLLGV
ncbi:MAG: hypothetical protein RBT45_01450 [Acholeplasmataceae bacterium]|nr:hypothetical protein [Acholeplasmataceae bacterium]